MRVVLDTNVLISALITKGKSSRLLGTVLERHILVLSLPLIEEFSRIAADRRIRRYVEADEVTAFLKVLFAREEMVQVRSRLTVLKNFDDYVLRAARDGRAEFIVTGDQHSLELKSFSEIKILTIAEAMTLLKEAVRS